MWRSRREAHWLRRSSVTGWVSGPCVNIYLALTHISNRHNYKCGQTGSCHVGTLSPFIAVTHFPPFHWSCHRNRSRIFLISASRHDLLDVSPLVSYSGTCTGDLWTLWFLRQQLSVCCELNVAINDSYIRIIASFYIQSFCKSQPRCC